MAALGPFEARPRVAVAVSGGADSLALAFLAAPWARNLGGEAVAVTVDHGLRAEAGAEAAQGGAWLTAAGIAHSVLTWTGPKPRSDIQAAARAARYRLLEEWCAERAILHLLLAHHLDDQAETVLLRLGRGSGVDGLAAMAPIRETRLLRLLRPVLTLPASRLRAGLAAVGQPWVDDPSNHDPAYARVRMRRLMPALAAEGLSAERLAATAAGMAGTRAALDGQVAAAALDHVRFHPAGFVHVAAGALATLPGEIGCRLLVRLLLAVGGGGYAPRRDRLDRLHRALVGGGAIGQTLGGCRIAAGGGGDVLICRETRALAAPAPLIPGRTIAWDGRFHLAVADAAPTGLAVGALGAEGWRVVCRERPALAAGWRREFPAAARAALPAIFATDGLCAVPHLGYSRPFTVAGALCPPVFDPGGALRWIAPAPMFPVTTGRGSTE